MRPLEGYVTIDRISIPFRFEADPNATLAENMEAWEAFARKTVHEMIKSDGGLRLGLRFEFSDPQQ